MEAKEALGTLTAGRGAGEGARESNESGTERSPFVAAPTASGMRPIRFETADTDDYTAIGEGLTRVARAAGRLETGRDVGKYALRHDDGCAVCGDPVATGAEFYLDPETGDVLCAEHGRARRGDE